MNERTIKAILARLDRIESALFVGNDSKVQGEKKPKDSSAQGLPAHILGLRRQGFFNAPKTAKEVHLKLQANYHCELDRVTMALLRLQRRKELRKNSKVVEKKKQVAYTW